VQCKGQPDHYRGMEDERPVGARRHAAEQPALPVAMHAEPADQEQRQRGGERPLDERRARGLPVPPAGVEVPLGRAIGEPAHEHQRAERHNSGQRRGPAPAAQRGRQRLQPAASSGGAAQPEQDRVLGKSANWMCRCSSP